MLSQYNIYIDQGTTFFVEIEVFENDAEIDLSDYTFISKMRKLYSPNSQPIPFAVNIDSGKIELSMNAATTRALTPGKYLYDVVMKDANGSFYIILNGLAFVIKTLTGSN